MDLNFNIEGFSEVYFAKICVSFFLKKIKSFKKCVKSF